MNISAGRGFIALTLLCLCWRSGMAQTSTGYLGAEAALRPLTSAVPKPRPKPPLPAPSPQAPPSKEELAAWERLRALRCDMDAFQKVTASLPPEEAAKQWLTLADRVLKSSKDQQLLQYGRGDNTFPLKTREKPVAFQELLLILPPPSAWQALRAAILARSLPEKTTSLVTARMLRLLAQVLVADADGQWNEVRALYTVMKEHPYKPDVPETSLFNSLPLDTILFPLLRQTSDPARMEEGVEMMIDISFRKHQKIPLPDFAAILPPERSQRLVLRLLTLPKENEINWPQIKWPEEGATRQLAKKIATGRASQLPLNPDVWFLAQGTDAESVALYQALEKRFGSERELEGDALLTSARTYYLLSLLQQNRTREAIALVQDKKLDLPSLYLPYDSIIRAGYGRQVYAFLSEMARKNPKSPLQDELITLALQVGKGDEVLALVRARAARKNLSAPERDVAREQLADALLAVDKVEEGIAVLRAAVRTQKARTTPTRETSQLIALGEKLIDLGKVLKRPALVNEGLEFVRLSIPTGAPYEQQQKEPYYALLLQEAGRGPEAERYLLAKMRSEVAQMAKQSRDKDDFLSNSVVNRRDQPLRPHLEALVNLYYRARRFADVLLLMDRAPQWGFDDLRDLLPYSSGETVPTGYIAARALVAKGRKTEAIPILKALLEYSSGYDPAYAFLLEQNGAAASLPFLDTLIAKNRFEERPLLWKAEALYRLKRYREAETAARAAITIDPSDGDEPHGDRMRVYAVLAKIRAARGDAKEAGFFREVVNAIRVAEAGDDLTEAGLISRGIKKYQQALTHFDDAYCIQSRLAAQLASQGRLAEAEAHYQRAYELMPDSFGRMESHCFGCEGAFTSGHGQQIAERVFNRLLTAHPQKPQLYYLRGYLRLSQKQYNDALADFRQAVTLDPDYINAYRKIEGMAENTTIPVADQDLATLNLIRLAPLNDLKTRETLTFFNLPSLYEIIETLEKEQPASPANPAPLLPFRGSAKAWATQPVEDFPPYPWNSDSLSHLTLLRHEGIRDIMAYMNVLIMYSTYATE